ncbi:hypothetical protein D9611_007291 [Ephemerocybe angulata]|uniref:CBM1 domain-containing protein n=1 Tax=Ephemerocybe angulata TaxID=980116 RepID=A0A8H5CGR2_9AGAR|nr:hypothetical protein D9611_007291 [Tulosesus angulatus]
MSPIARLFTISGYILVLTQASSVSAEDTITPPPATTTPTTPSFPTTLTCTQGGPVPHCCSGTSTAWTSTRYNVCPSFFCVKDGVIASQCGTTSPGPIPNPVEPVKTLGQCGGQGWIGGTQCVSTDLYRSAMNSWYAQCVPTAAATTIPAVTITPVPL